MSFNKLDLDFSTLKSVPSIPTTGISLSSIKSSLSSLLSTTNDHLAKLTKNHATLQAWINEPKSILSNAGTTTVSKSDGNVSIKLTSSNVIKLKEKRASTTEDVTTAPHTPVPKHTPPKIRSSPAPPEVISGDYSKAKPPANQIPLQNFISFTDQYFRNITIEDMHWLARKNDYAEFGKDSYIIPNLGIHYLDQWNGNGPRGMGIGGTEFDSLQHQHRVQGIYQEIDDTVYNGDVYFGSFTERVLAALVDENITHLGEDSSLDQVLPGSNSNNIPHRSSKDRGRTFDEMMSFEDRIKEELRFIGIIEEEFAPTVDPIVSTSPILSSQEDEITRELAKAQAELRKKVEINNARKDALEKVAKKWMAYQEYNTIIDDLDKSIEIAYARRFKASKKPKKNQQKVTEKKSVPENVISTIVRRQKLQESVGAVFDDIGNVSTQTIFTVSR